MIEAGSKRLSQDSEDWPNRGTILVVWILTTLTPTLSQRKREPSGAASSIPSPFGRGQGEGHSCYDFSPASNPETVSSNSLLL